ncbi:hypothetical protein VNI00_008959, partial [Paramarasmius palmivorus]
FSRSSQKAQAVLRGNSPDGSVDGIPETDSEPVYADSGAKETVEFPVKSEMYLLLQSVLYVTVEDSSAGFDPLSSQSGRCQPRREGQKRPSAKAIEADCTESTLVSKVDAALQDISDKLSGDGASDRSYQPRGRSKSKRGAGKTKPAKKAVVNDNAAPLEDVVSGDGYKSNITMRSESPTVPATPVQPQKQKGGRDTKELFAESADADQSGSTLTVAASDEEVRLFFRSPIRCQSTSRSEDVAKAKPVASGVVIGEQSQYRGGHLPVAHERWYSMSLAMFSAAVEVPDEDEEDGNDTSPAGQLDGAEQSVPLLDPERIHSGLRALYEGLTWVNE